MATVDTTSGGEAKTLRADARRNRERVLAAASDAFAAEGFDVGVAEIARRAGVGTGTLFRHFPTKLELEVAVILARKQEMMASVRAALAEPDPWAGFARMMTDGVEMTACDRCIGQVASPELLADERMQAAPHGAAGRDRAGARAWSRGRRRCAPTSPPRTSSC